MTNNQQIPEGYWRNARGGLDPVDLIALIDKERDQLAKKLVAQAKALQATMAAFKSGAFGDIDAFVGRSAEHYGHKMGGQKGNMTLPTYDGKYRIQVAVSDRLHYDERIQVAKDMVYECIREWTVDSSPEIKALIDHAFQVDKEGKLNIGRLLSLTRLSIDDPKWKKAMKALRDSMQVESTSIYLRIYERIGDGKQYKQISLDMAKL